MGECIIKRQGGAVDVSDLTAAPADVVAGEKFYGSGTDEIQTGTQKNNGKISFHNTDNVKETAWTQNHLVFESEKLGSVFQKIERWYGVHIDLLCPEIANDQISGSFKDEQLPYVMEALKFQYGFNYEITGNNVTINKSNQLKIK